MSSCSSCDGTRVRKRGSVEAEVHGVEIPLIVRDALQRWSREAGEIVVEDDLEVLSDVRKQWKGK